jgi:hypothetical protein
VSGTDGRKILAGQTPIDVSGFQLREIDAELNWAEARPSLHKVAGGLAAAELLGQQDMAQERAAGQADDRLRGVAATLVDQLIADRQSERVLDPGVQIGERLEHGCTGQALRNRLAMM